MKIREVAAAHNIPVVENPPLARALHATVEMDQEVPPEHYKAVAEVIGYVMKLRGAVTALKNQPNRGLRLLRSARRNDTLGTAGFAGDSHGGTRAE